MGKRTDARGKSGAGGSAGPYLNPEMAAIMHTLGGTLGGGVDETKKKGKGGRKRVRSLADEAEERNAREQRKLDKQIAKEGKKSGKRGKGKGKNNSADNLNTASDKLLPGGAMRVSDTDTLLFHQLVDAKAEELAGVSAGGLNVAFFKDMIVEGVLDGSWTCDFEKGRIYKNRQGKGGKQQTTTRQRRGNKGGSRMYGNGNGSGDDEFDYTNGFGGYGHNWRGGGTHYYGAGQKWDPELKCYVRETDDGSPLDYPTLEFEPRFPEWMVDVPSLKGGYCVIGNIPEGSKMDDLFTTRRCPTLFFTPAVWQELTYMAKSIKTEWAVMLLYQRLSDESSHWLCYDYIIAGQVVGGATVDLDNRDLRKYYDLLLQKYPNRFPDEATLQASLGHLHSHVGMATGFSGTDIQTQENIGQLAFATPIRFFLVINNREEVNAAALMYSPLYVRMDKVPWGLYWGDPKAIAMTEERKAWIKDAHEKLIFTSESAARKKYGKLKVEPVTTTTTTTQTSTTTTTSTTGTSTPIDTGAGNVVANKNGARHKTFLATDPDCQACQYHTCDKDKVGADGYTYCPKGTWPRNAWEQSNGTSTNKATTVKAPQETLRINTAKFGLPDACPVCKKEVYAWTYVKYRTYGCPHCKVERELTSPDASDAKEGDRAPANAAQTAVPTQGTTSSTQKETPSAVNAGLVPMQSGSSAAVMRALELGMNAAQGVAGTSPIAASSLEIAGIATDSAVPELWSCFSKQYPLSQGQIKRISDVVTSLMAAGQHGNLWDFWGGIQGILPEFPGFAEKVAEASKFDIAPLAYCLMASTKEGEALLKNATSMDSLKARISQPERAFMKTLVGLNVEAILYLILDVLVSDTLLITNIVATDAVTKRKIDRMIAAGEDAKKKFPLLLDLFNKYGLRLGNWYSPTAKNEEEKKKSKRDMVSVFFAGILELYQSESKFTTFAELDARLASGIENAARALAVVEDNDEVNKALQLGDLLWNVSEEVHYDVKGGYFNEPAFMKCMIIEALRYFNPLAMDYVRNELNESYVLGLFVPDDEDEVIDDITKEELRRAESDTPSASMTPTGKILRLPIGGSADVSVDDSAQIGLSGADLNAAEEEFLDAYRGTD